MSSINNKIIGGVFWTTFETVINRSLGFIIQMVLARLLFPTDYGLVGMAIVFISFVEVFNDLGMNAALIQKKQEKLTPLHFDTAFWTGVVWSVLLYLLIFFILTPVAVSFYEEEMLGMIMPVLSISVLLSPINLVHRAQLIKSMNFKKLAIVNNLSSFISGGIALILAFLDFGVWALVFYSVTRVLVAVPLFFKATGWKPRWHWDKNIFKEIFSFGAYTTGTSLANKLTGNIDYLLVGKLVGTAALGFYSFAFMLTNILRDQIVAIVNKVIYPVYASLQDDKKKMSDMFLKVISINNLIVYPVVLGVFLFAENFLPIFFGEKWNASVPIIEILCFAVFIQMLNNSHTTLLRAAGKVKLELLLQIIKSVFLFTPLIILGVYYKELEGAALGFTIATFLGVLLSFYFMYKIFNIRLIDVFKAVKVSLLMILICLPTTLILKQYVFWMFCVLYFGVAVFVIYYIFARHQLMALVKMVKNKK